MTKVISFVILHYKDYKTTVNCIQSILQNVSYVNKKIVVVDNGSDDFSGENLQEQYKSNNNVHIILNKKNQGYARGNNIGYSFSKDKLNSDFIVILNNDTVIKQKEFCDTVIKIYQEKSFFLLGPDIYSLSNSSHQSPIRKEPLTKEEVYGYLKKYDDFEKNKVKSILKVKMNDLKSIVKKRMNPDQIIKYRTMRKKDNFINSYKEEKENVVLHGACVIFSPLYIDKKEYAFYPKTFLFYEEEIMTLICTYERMKIVYSPELQVLHYEDLATNKLVKNSYEKELFKIKHQRFSANVYLELLHMLKI